MKSYLEALQVVCFNVYRRSTVQNVTIIGHGPAGLRLQSMRAGLAPLISSSAELGQLDQTTDVENFPGFPVGIMGPEIIVNMHKQAERFGAQFRTAHVSAVEGDGPYILKTDDGDINTKTIIIATGAKPRRLGLDSEALYWVTGFQPVQFVMDFFTEAVKY